MLVPLRPDKTDIFDHDVRGAAEAEPHAIKRWPNLHGPTRRR